MEEQDEDRGRQADERASSALAAQEPDMIQFHRTKKPEQTKRKTRGRIFCLTESFRRPRRLLYLTEQHLETDFVRKRIIGSGNKIVIRTEWRT